MGMRLIAVFALIFMLASQGMAAGDKAEVTCPLTKAYMLEMLTSLNREITIKTHPIPDKYYAHATRMAGEIQHNEFSELKAEIKSDKKSCSYFWIAVHLDSVNDYPPGGRPKELEKLEHSVNKCIQWVSSHQFSNENNVESEFCK
jgi:hypothetical protein